MAKKKDRKWSAVPTAKGGTEVLIRTGGTDADEAAAQAAAVLDDDAKTPPEPGAEDVEDFIGQLPQEARVQLWKWAEPTADEWNYAGAFPPHGFTLDSIARTRGAGKYLVIVRGPKTMEDGKTKVVQLARRHVSVAGNLAPAGGATGTPGLIEQGLVQLMGLQSTMLQTLMQGMGQKESMASVVQAVAALVNKPSPPALSDDLMKVLIAKALQREDRGGGGFEELLAVLEKGMELGAAAEGSDGLGGFAKVFADLVKDMRERRVNAPAAPPPVRVGPGVVVGEIAPAPPAPAPDPTAQAGERFFRDMTALLAAPSQRNADLDLYADLVVDAIPPELDPHLNQWINDPSYPEPLLALFPGVAVVWLRALLLKVRDVLINEDDDPDGQARTVDGGDDPDSRRGSGDDDDPAAHASVRERGLDRSKRSSVRPNRH